MSPYNVDMGSTATIRVSRETRDLLAAQAHARGISVAAMLAEMARRTRREENLLLEREATQQDLANPEVTAEESDWAEADGDGTR